MQTDVNFAHPMYGQRKTTSTAAHPAKKRDAADEKQKSNYCLMCFPPIKSRNNNKTGKMRKPERKTNDVRKPNWPELGAVGFFLASYKQRGFTVNKTKPDRSHQI